MANENEKNILLGEPGSPDDQTAQDVCDVLVLSIPYCRLQPSNKSQWAFVLQAIPSPVVSF